MAKRGQPVHETEVFCSTVIATIGHSRLPAAVCSVLDQKFTAAGFEVIVVNDSGEPLPEMEWQHSERVRVVCTQRRERSVARNTGAAIARGKYLHILDQDDRMLPGALQAFWDRAQTTDAVWLCGGYELVDDEDQLLEEHQSNFDGDVFALAVAGEIVHLGASLLRTIEFFEAGSFDPSFCIVEDFDLVRRLAFLGNAATTPAVVARIRRSGGPASSGDWSKFSKLERRSREKILAQPGALGRLRESTADNDYLRGRVSRVYLASLLWCLQQGDLFTAASRLVSAAAFTHLHVLSDAYWRGLRRMKPCHKGIR